MWETCWKYTLQPAKKCKKAKYRKKNTTTVYSKLYNAGVISYEMTIGIGDLENDHTCNLADQLTLDGRSSETSVLKNQ